MTVAWERLELERLARQMIYLDHLIVREPQRADDLRISRDEVQQRRSELLHRIWERQRETLEQTAKPHA